MTRPTETDTIWGLVRLDGVQDVLDAYQLWKDSDWYHEVDWAVVSALLDHSLRRHGSAATGLLMWDRIGLSAKRLRDTDQWGLMSLLQEPVTVTPVQLTNGGHRLHAMRVQGVPSVPGMFRRADVGTAVCPEDVYRIA